MYYHAGTEWKFTVIVYILLKKRSQALYTGIARITSLNKKQLNWI